MVQILCFRKISLLWLIGIVMPFCLFARDWNLIDSLNEQLALQNDTSMFSKCMNYADELYFAGNISESAYFYELAAEIEKKQSKPDSYRLSSAYGYGGNCLYELGQYPKAIDWFEKSLVYSIELKDSIEIASLYVNIGNAYFYQGIYQESINYFKKALTIDLAQCDSINIAISLNNLGKVFHAWQQYTTAIDFYTQALEIGRLKNDSNGVSIRLSSIAASYMELKQYETSMSFYSKAYAIDSLMHNKARMSGRLDQVGMVYQKMGEYPKAESYFLKALNLLSELENPRSEALVRSNLGQNYLLSGKLKKAKSYFDQSLELAGKMHLTQAILNNYWSLSELYDRTGDFRKSKQYLEQYMMLKDSVFNVQSQKTIDEFEVFYETEKKDFEITKLSQEKEIQTIQIKKTRQQRLFFVLLAITLLTVAGLLYILFENRKKTGRILDAKNKELAILNSTKDRFISILAHDLKNPFSAFANITTSVNENFDELERSEHKYYIEELNRSALQMNSMLKNMLEWATIQMKPVYATLETLDLHKITQQMIDSLSGFAQTRSVTLNNEIPVGLMAQGNHGAVSIVLNNLITNAIKFSYLDGQVIVKGEVGEKMVSISIVDRGLGMTKDDIAKLFRIDKDTRSIGRPEGKGTGLGLILCKELMNKMRGDIYTESISGEGTIFYINLQKAKE